MSGGAGGAYPRVSAADGGGSPGGSSSLAELLARPPDSISRLRTSTLSNLLAGDAADRARGHNLFEGLLARGHADVYSLSVMLWATCGSADEQLALMARARARGLKPDASSYNVVLGRMQMEGVAAERVPQLLKMMEAEGVALTPHVRSALGRTEDSISRMRTVLLRRLVSGGDAADVATARRLFDGLLARGLATSHHANALLRATTDPSERRRLLARAEGAALHLRAGRGDWPRVSRTRGGGGGGGGGGRSTGNS